MSAPRRKVLVTGGAGYIGSHATLALLEAGHDVLVVDNLSRGSPVALARIAELAGRAPAFEQADLRDRDAIGRVLAAFRPDAVLHFAGLKSVEESVRDPKSYWDTNLEGTANLLDAMEAAGVRAIVFSSTAMVYGAASTPPFTEEAPVAPVNPYGATKLAVEHRLAERAAASPGWRVAMLRYFNPVGAHASARLGEEPGAAPTNLMPRLCRAAAGIGEPLSIHGDDYPTADGTAVRDYVHVQDLAAGHLAALALLDRLPGPATAINLGLGSGRSVREVIAAFERATGVAVPHQVAPRRAGDVAVLVADCAKAQRLLGWEPTRTLDDMCRDAWRWQQRNPRGYA